MLVFLAEIAEQHATATFVFGSGVLYYGLNSGHIALLTVFIYIMGDGKAMAFLSFTGIYYIRCLFAWDIVQYMPAGQHQQDFVNALACQTGTDG